MYQEYPTPAVVVELDIVENNIRGMVEQNARHNIAHRPHIKPHKSIELARLQLALGAKGITCAKLGEAEVMARAGIRDILVAFPLIGEDKLRRLAELMRIAEVKTIVNSEVGAQALGGLGASIGKPIDVLIEVDGGSERGGLAPGKPTLDFAHGIRSLAGIRICGILHYNGGIYHQNTMEGVAEETRRERDEAVGTARLLADNGFAMDVVSVGSSFSGKSPEDLEGVTEVRSGNYLFNDGAQLYSGLVAPEDCALRVVSTVVSRPDAQSAIIDAGVKCLTSDLAVFGDGYGYVLGHPDIAIHKLNEEHGFLRGNSELPFRIGDKIAVIPNHACVVPNLVEELYGLRGGKFDHMIRVDARGKNV